VLKELKVHKVLFRELKVLKDLKVLKELKGLRVRIQGLKELKEL
jgi:hypothetical protein